MLRRLDFVLAPTKPAVLAEHQAKVAAKAGLLYLVVEKFAGIDLHPDRVDNVQMGLIFEELIRRFAEISNETAGGALHAARGNPADGEPALHRG